MRTPHKVIFTRDEKFSHTRKPLAKSTRGLRKMRGSVVAVPQIEQNPPSLLALFLDLLDGGQDSHDFLLESGLPCQHLKTSG